jgi:hypothetical protein
MDDIAKFDAQKAKAQLQNRALQWLSLRIENTMDKNDNMGFSPNESYGISLKLQLLFASAFS